MVEFVAEFTTNHMGNLNLLLKMVDAAKAAGASWIKMQKKDVENFYTQEKLDSLYDSPYGKTYRDYRTTFEFDDESFRIFDRKCREVNIPWFATVQDCNSLDWMLYHFPDIPMLKLASSNARNYDLISRADTLLRTDKPLVLSVGGSTLDDIDKSLSRISENRLVYILHCVAEYPCPDQSLRLGNITKLIDYYKDRPNIKIGFSSHELGIIPSLAAIGLGSALIERHFCLSRHSFVHHIDCSLEPNEFKNLVDLSQSPKSVQNALDTIDPLALSTGFGMSDVEKEFLVNQTYGKKYLGKRSSWTL